MYQKKTIDELIRENDNEIIYKFKINTFEFISTESGKIFRLMKSGFWKEIENKSNHCKGYNVILINKKQYSRSKLILHATKQIDITDKNIVISHLNGNKLDCSIKNLHLKKII